MRTGAELTQTPYPGIELGTFDIVIRLTIDDQRTRTDGVAE